MWLSFRAQSCFHTNLLLCLRVHVFFWQLTGRCDWRTVVVKVMEKNISLQAFGGSFWVHWCVSLIPRQWERRRSDGVNVYFKGESFGPWGKRVAAWENYSKEMKPMAYDACGLYLPPSLSTGLWKWESWLPLTPPPPAPSEPRSHHHQLDNRLDVKADVVGMGTMLPY